jgi:hypothetical protein
MNRVIPIVLVFWMLAMFGCAHSHPRMQNAPVISVSGPNTTEAKDAGSARVVAYPEAEYVYAVGIGKFPADSISPAQGWARAKRAAVDTATANLLAEAERQHRTDLQAIQGTPADQAIQDGSESLRGSIGQAEML